MRGTTSVAGHWTTDNCRPAWDHPPVPTILIVGAGTAGAVLAARLSENTAQQVTLAEAGPDYGPFDSGCWPADLLDASRITQSHDWDVDHDRTVSIRARVLGGSSTHNACVVAWGAPSDYDEWAPWSFSLLRPHLARAEDMLGAMPVSDDDLSPWHRAMLDSAAAVGFPPIPTINDLTATVGAAPLTLNVRDGVRWNAAFAYLDEARERRNLRIVPNALVDRVAFADDRAIGALINGKFVRADQIILAAGAYGTPAILQRSGVGPAAHLAKLGIPLVADLPVGEQLVDHPGVSIEWAPSKQLRESLGQRIYPEGQALVRARSRLCSKDTWDLHVFPRLAVSSETGVPRPSATIYALKPASAGSVRIRSRDPLEPLDIDSGFLSSESDLDCLIDGLTLARTLAATSPLRDLVAAEVRPGELPPEQYVRERVSSFFHPTGTCALRTVVSSDAAVRGLSQLYVADASIMPSIPRANTNLTIAGVAEYLSCRLLGQM